LHAYNRGYRARQLTKADKREPHSSPFNFKGPLNTDGLECTADNKHLDLLYRSIEEVVPEEQGARRGQLRRLLDALPKAFTIRFDPKASRKSVRAVLRRLSKAAKAFHETFRRMEALLTRWDVCFDTDILGYEFYRVSEDDENEKHPCDGCGLFLNMDDFEVLQQYGGMSLCSECNDHYVCGGCGDYVHPKQCVTVQSSGTPFEPDFMHATCAQEQAEYEKGLAVRKALAAAAAAKDAAARSGGDKRTRAQAMGKADEVGAVAAVDRAAARKAFMNAASSAGGNKE
jgi:hypothetical protein